MQLWRQFLNWGQTPAGVQQDWCWHVRFDAWLFKLSDALMPAFDAGHPLLAHAGSVQVAVFSHPTSISDITPSHITLSPHFNITFVPYNQYWRDEVTCLVPSSERCNVKIQSMHCASLHYSWRIEKLQGVFLLVPPILGEPSPLEPPITPKIVQKCDLGGQKTG